MRKILTGALALLGFPTLAFASRPIAPEDAPKAWVVYAEAATRTVSGWLNTDAPEAEDIRAALDRTRPAPDQPTLPLVVRLWIDRNGLVSRAEFPALAEDQASRSLKILLLGSRLGPPPKGMLQPMRIALQLPPASTDKTQ